MRDAVAIAALLAVSAVSACTPGAAVVKPRGGGEGPAATSEGPAATPDPGDAHGFPDAGAPAPLSAAANDDTARSVLLVVVDALNAGHLGFSGYSRPTSPNLDRLAKRGIVLSNYVSNSSWTRPSFTTIVTGLPKREHGVELNGRPLADGMETLAERFSAAGYRTAGFVGNPLVGRAVGYAQGFQVYVDTGRMGRIFPPDEGLVDRAIRWLKQDDERPFFALLFLTAPHAPYKPPEGYRRFLDGVPKGRVVTRPQREYREPLPGDVRERIVAAYDGEVSYADAQLGRLLAFLDESGMGSRTTVLVTADHGEAFGEHNCYTHTYHMWEPVLRVPFVLSSPAFGSAGRVDDRPFTHLDIAPTLLDLAGVRYAAAELPGVSIARALRGPPGAGRDRMIFSQYDAHGVRREAIRRGGLKLIHHHRVEKIALERLDELSDGPDRTDPRDLPSLSWDGERYELYDLAEDPGESKDLYAARRDDPAVRDLLRGIEENETGSRPVSALPAATVESLVAIGYIRDPAEEPAPL